MKTTRKLLPLSVYDIPGIEAWLEDQANHGLFPVFLDAWATFEPTGVPGTRFRLEPWGKMGTSPSEEQLELYHQAGWEYALTVGRAYFLFYTTDPDAPDLYTDHLSRGMSLERLEKRVRRYRRFKIAVWSILAALLAWGLFLPSKFDVQHDPFAKLPVLLLHLFNPILLLFIIQGVFLWLQSARDRRILTKTCRALKEGLPPPPSPGPSRTMAREQKASLILIPVLLVAFVYMIMNNRGQLAVPVEDFTRPYISLQELEQVELVSSQEVFGNSSFHEDENQAENHLSLLSPVWYSVTQDACEVTEGDYKGYSPNPEDGTYRYSPWLDMTYFHLSIPALARPVAKSQMDHDRAVNLYWTYEELSYPGLDFVILATEPDGIWQGLALGKGGRVAVFHYGGMEDLTDHLDLLSTMVTG